MIRGRGRRGRSPLTPIDSVVDVANVAITGVPSIITGDQPIRASDTTSIDMATHITKIIA